MTVGETQPKMNAEWPRAGTTVYAPFNISGWALDTGGGEGVGTGVDQVQVFEGSVCSGKLLGETNAFYLRSDVMRHFDLDSSYQNGGFGVIIADVDPGALTYTVCARSALTGQPQKSTRTVTVGSAYAFEENFTDGDISQNPNWRANNDAYSIVDEILHSSGLQDGNRYRTIYETDIQISASDYLEFSYRGMIKSGDLEGIQGITVVLVGIVGGYDLNIQRGVIHGFDTDQTSISLSYRDNVSIFDLIVTQYSPEYDRYYLVKAIRENGFWTLYVDGIAVGTASDPLEISEFQKVHMPLTGKVSIDDIHVLTSP